MRADCSPSVSSSTGSKYAVWLVSSLPPNIRNCEQFRLFLQRLACITLENQQPIQELEPKASGPQDSTVPPNELKQLECLTDWDANKNWLKSAAGMCQESKIVSSVTRPTHHFYPLSLV